MLSLQQIVKVARANANNSIFQLDLGKIFQGLFQAMFS
jgi:hypothetical protein